MRVQSDGEPRFGRRHAQNPSFSGKYLYLSGLCQAGSVHLQKHDHQILKHSLPIEKEEPLRKELEHFCECIREDKTPLISGKEAQEALKVALAITQQIWDNRKNISSS